jgi:hypothetical protein
MRKRYHDLSGSRSGAPSEQAGSSPSVSFTGLVGLIAPYNTITVIKLVNQC